MQTFEYFTQIVIKQYKFVKVFFGGGGGGG